MDTSKKQQITAHAEALTAAGAELAYALMAAHAAYLAAVEAAHAACHAAVEAADRAFPEGAYAQEQRYLAIRDRHAKIAARSAEDGSFGSRLNADADW